MQIPTEQQISLIVRTFYNRVRSDADLGPVFAVVKDWEEHITRLTEFWSSVAAMTGKYKGNPIAMHLIHAERMRPGMFVRWLELWTEATNAVLEPETAWMMQAKASRIATRLSMAIFSKALTPVSNECRQQRPFRRSADFSEATIPEQLLRPQSTDQGTWLVVRVGSGAIGYRDLDRGMKSVVDHERPQMVPPGTRYQFELIGPFEIRFEFFDHNPSSLL